MNISKAQQILSILENFISEDAEDNTDYDLAFDTALDGVDMSDINEVSRRIGAVLRHAPLGYEERQISHAVVKGVTRKVHGAGALVKEYKAARKDIKSQSVPITTKSRQLNQLHADTVHKIASHVAQAKGDENVTGSHRRTAHRIIHGTAFGTKGF